MDPVECLRIASSSANVAKLNNKEAADLLTQNRAEFIAKVKACVQTSQERLYDEAPTEDPHYLCFERFDADVHGPVLEKLKTGNAVSAATDKNSGGLSWVKEGEFKPLGLE